MIFLIKLLILIVFLGNEVYITEISTRIKNILLSRGIIGDDNNDLRRINLFLMFNTDAAFKFDLQNDQSICHLINNFPQLTKCLYANLMWELKLEKHFYEALKFTPSWFMLQFLEEVIDSLRFSKTFDVIVQVNKIVEGIYTNICRMDYRMKAEEVVNQKIVLGRFLDHISTALRHYNTPCADTEVTKSKKKLKEYLGSSLNQQLSLILACFKMFEEKPKFNVEEKLQIYKVMREQEPEVDNFSSKSYSPPVNEILTNINIILLNTLQNSVLNITIDDFMYWVEIDIEDTSNEDVDLKCDNLQKSIGVQSYALMEIINNNPALDHDVVKQLSTIAIKPKTLEEVAKEATVGTVLDKIETSISRKVWIEELLSRPDALYFNTECLQTLIENVELLELKHFWKILNDHLEFASSMDAEDEAQIKEIFYKGSTRLSSVEILEFIEELIRKQGEDYFLVGDVDNEFTNYFNKITEDEIDESTMWQLIFRYPQRFYEMLLDDIKIQDESQITTALKIISETRVIAVHYVQNIVINNLSIPISSTKSLKHVFLSGIFKLQIMERKEFVKNIIMQNLSQVLSTNKSITLLMLLRVLQQISSHLKITDFLPPLMIQLSQIMEQNRWDIMSYSTIKEDIVDIAASIISDTLKTILKHGSKNDKEWIKARIENHKPITKYYFQKLALEKGEPVIPFDLFLHPDGFSNAPKSKITSFLCETLVRCTSKECKRLMKNEILQNFFTDALIVLAVIAGKSNEPNPLNCLHKCVTDYAKILIVS